MMQPDFGPASALIDDLLKALERRLIGLVGGDLSLKLKGIGRGKRTECDPTVWMLRPGMPMAAIEHIHLNVSYQHPLVFPGFTSELNVEVFADKASTAVGCDDVLSSDLLLPAIVQKRGRYLFLVLLDIDQFGCQLDLRSPSRQALAQNLFDAKLRNEEDAGIGHLRSWLTLCVEIDVPQGSGAVVASERKVKASVGKDLVNDSQVIQYFKTAGLQAFAARPGKIGCDLIDDSEIYAAARQVTGHSQPGGPSAYDQHIDRGGLLIKFGQRLLLNLS